MCRTSRLNVLHNRNRPDTLISVHVHAELALDFHQNLAFKLLESTAINFIHSTMQHLRADGLASETDQSPIQKRRRTEDDEEGDNDENKDSNDNDDYDDTDDEDW